MNTHLKELIAVGASVAANCIPCVQYHAAQAKKHGVSEDDLVQAIRIAKGVRRGAGGKMDETLAALTAQSTLAPVEKTKACGCS